MTEAVDLRPPIAELVRIAGDENVITHEHQRARAGAKKKPAKRRKKF